MVAQGDHVGPGVKNGLSLLWGDAYPGGIFTVDHGEIHVLELLERAQVMIQIVQPRISHYIPYGQQSYKHSDPPFDFLLSL